LSSPVCLEGGGNDLIRSDAQLGFLWFDLRAGAPDTFAALIGFAVQSSGQWMNIDGWRDSVIECIRALEQTKWVN